MSLFVSDLYINKYPIFELKLDGQGYYEIIGILNKLKKNLACEFKVEKDDVLILQVVHNSVKFTIMCVNRDSLVHEQSIEKIRRISKNVGFKVKQLKFEDATIMHLLDMIRHSEFPVRVTATMLTQCMIHSNKLEPIKYDESAKPKRYNLVF